MSVLIETTSGNLILDLYTTCRPRTCTNFLKLSKIKFYNFSLIYNLKRDFCIQLGKSWDKNISDRSFFVNLYGRNATKFENEKDRPPRIKHLLEFERLIFFTQQFLSHDPYLIFNKKTLYVEYWVRTRHTQILYILKNHKSIYRRVKRRQ